MIKLKNKSVISLLLFFINPFICFIYNINFRHFKYSKKYIILFFSLIGYTFMPPRNWDMYRYMEDFKLISKVQDIGGLSPHLDRLGEPIFYTLLYFIGKITNKLNIISFLSALIYFYFLVSIIYELNSLRKKNIYTKLASICIFTFFPIYSFNGIRFWNSTVIFIFGSILIFLKNNKKGWIYIFLSSFIHTSFIYLVILTYIYLYLKKIKYNLNLIYLCLIGIITFIGIENIIFKILSKLSPVYLIKFNEYFLKKMNTSNIYINLSNFLILVLFLYMNFSNFKNKKNIFIEWNTFLLISIIPFYRYITVFNRYYSIVSMNLAISIFLLKISLRKKMLLYLIFIVFFKNLIYLKEGFKSINFIVIYQNLFNILQYEYFL